ncbi:malonyl-CoA/methylmalonyl-CoA synthetase [Sphingopyxis panaciterrae]|uniref:malonate--CoA ligase n=1 Tax=Sphingopyxis panaciterrae TaxID=363841 RepID=UPI00141DA8FC|nr:malonyl-CoA synthase [Sphingopyxis panaciterrae]NIJ35835.1 malonyl-CoA/methylmalonyl-CoA synthetase [Sphingopyxis panaciterrae]
MSNLYSRLAAEFPANRGRVFAWLADSRSLSYGGVEAESARYANALRELGVGIGDRVAVQVEKSAEMLLLYLGCLRLGAVFLPLNTAYTAGELEYFVGDAEPALLVCDPAAASVISALPAAGSMKVETLDAAGDGTLAELARRASPVFATVARDDNDLAAILYTSGTTGRSKGAMLSHGNLASNAFALRDIWRFAADDVLLHALPIFHTHGLFVATNVMLACGGSMILLPRFEVGEVMATLPRATVMMGVPTFYIRLLGEAGFGRELVSHMRLFISGSAPLAPDVHREFEARTGHAILERYGMTETNMNISNPYDGERIPGTVGLPLPGVEIRIADSATGRVLPQGEVGVIEIRGPNVFKGYWRLPEKTAAEFRDGFFISGDMGRIDQNGYISIVGREKDLIIAGGLNIYPAEVEDVIGALPAVREVAVIGLPHPDLGEAVVAVIVPRDAAFADAAAISDALRDKLARFKQPRMVLFTDELPKNTMGKVQKAELRKHHACLFASRG